MTKLIVVVGATGGQGGGVVDAFLKSPEYHVRGITRNPSGDKAKALLAKGVEVVAADLDDEKSLEKAFEGAYAIFGVTNYYDYFFSKGKDASMELEFTQGTNMARAASRIPTLKRYVCSTLPHTSRITGGKAVVPHFEGKGRASTFIKENLPELYAKTTFTIFTIFAVNMHHYPIFRPVYLASAQKWVQFYPTSPDSAYPCVGDHATNSGIFVRAIVERPPAEAGIFVRCSVEDLSIKSYLALWGKASGISPEPNSTQVVQISVADYNSLWGHMGEEQSSQWVFFEHLARMREQGLIGDDIPGATMVEGLSLLSEDEKRGLKSVEASLKELDWSSIILRSSL